MVEQRTTKSDLELFTREITWDPQPTLSKFYSPAAFGTIGFGVALAMNFYARRPLLSGIQRHIAFTGLGIPVGLFVDQKLDERHARRDAALIAFMKAYPEDFPEQERIKFKDVFNRWIPRR